MSHNSVQVETNEGVEMAHKVKTNHNFPTVDDDGAVLGTVPKQAFRSTRIAFKKLLQNFKKII